MSLKMQGPDDDWSCQPVQATCTGQQGIKVLQRQEQGNTVRAADVKVKLSLFFYYCIWNG